MDDMIKLIGEELNVKEHRKQY